MPGEFRKLEHAKDFFKVTFVVDSSNKGARADLFLKRHYRHRSRNQIQKAIEEGRVQLQGRRLKPSTALFPGDVVEVWTQKKSTVEPIVDFNYRVHFEDDHLIVLDKPSSLPVHPAGRFLFHTLLHRLRMDKKDWVCPEKEKDFYLIHRLDRETSGLMVLAKQKKAAAHLIRQFFDRSTEKRYFAVTRGHLPSDHVSLESDIGPAVDSLVRLRMQAFPKGTGERLSDIEIQSAHTVFRRVRQGVRYDVLECELKTGRQHQIRVHLESLGVPVLGDKLYSGGRPDLFLQYAETGVFTDEMREVFRIERQALHSCFLKFQHPITKEILEFHSILPDDLERVVLADAINHSAKLSI